MTQTNDSGDRLPTFDDLRCHYQTGRAFLLSGEGRNKVHGYRNGVMCNLGDIERSEWQRMMRELIHRAGEDELHHQLTLWEREHCYLNQSREKFEHHVLELHSARIFDSQKWVDFIPFNQKYRPEALHGIPVATVATGCCGIPFLASQEVLSQDNGTTHCKVCGRWAPYKILSASTL